MVYYENLLFATLDDNTSGSSGLDLVYDQPEVESISPTPDFDLSGVDYSLYLHDLSTVQRPWTEDAAFWPAIVTYGLTFVAGTTGNLMVVFALTFDRQETLHNVTAVFLVSLVIADLLFILVCVPYEIAVRFAAHWNGGLYLCKLAGFVEMLSGSAAVLNLTAISVERSAIFIGARFTIRHRRRLPAAPRKKGLRPPKSNAGIHQQQIQDLTLKRRLTGPGPAEPIAA